MEFTLIDEYIGRMPFTDRYKALDTDSRQAVVFAAEERLADEYGRERLTERTVALQALYMIEGEAEEFAKLKRHGVKTYNVKGISVTFDGSGISPEAARILERPLRGAGTGRLI